MLFLNNHAKSSANVPFVVAPKYIILDNLLQTTRIMSFLPTNGNLVMKSTVKYAYNFSSTSLNFNFPTGILVLFFIL